MRLFFAADIDQDVNKRVDEAIAGFRRIDPSVKWVRPENHHITLYFFGEVEERAEKSIESILDGAARGMLPFHVCIRGISAFPTLERPRVLWVGIENESGELAKLYASIREGVIKAKLPVNVENRNYAPHLTIGRVKERCSSSLIQEVKRSDDTAFGEFYVKALVLYQSVLRREGPLYTPLKVFTLS